MMKEWHLGVVRRKRLLFTLRCWAVHNAESQSREGHRSAVTTAAGITSGPVGSGGGPNVVSALDLTYKGP